MLPVIDLHCDTLSKLSRNPDYFFLPQQHTQSHVFYSGLKSAGTALQCFAVYTDLLNTSFASPLSCVTEQISCFRRLMSLSDKTIEPVYTYSDLEKNMALHKLSALLTLEESCLSEDPVSLLPTLYALGIRIATLTWNYPNLLGSPAFDASPSSLRVSPQPLTCLIRPNPSHSGLTPLGFDFVTEAEHLGIIIDVSHLSDAGFYNVASHSRRPFLASHSNARSECNVPRNLSDRMLRTLAEHGGVAGLNLHEPFLISGRVSEDELLSAIIRHVKHIISVAGIDTPALGTDFDGIPGNCAIPDITYLPRIRDALSKAGLTDGELEKLFYKNVLRFFYEYGL